MATKNQKVKVGIFLTSTLAMLVAGLAVVAGYRGGSEETYTVIFEESVLGLSKGGQVVYEGVPIGRVDDIRIGDRQRAVVKIVIDTERITLYKGVKAKLEIYSLATGQMIVALAGGDPEKGPHPRAQAIPTAPSIYAALGTEASDLIEDIRLIVAQLKVGLSGMEEGQLTAMLGDTQAAIASVGDLAKHMQEDVARVARQFERVATGVEVGVERFNDAIPEVHRLAERARVLADESTEMVRVVRTKFEPLDVEGLFNDVRADLDEVSAGIQNVANTVDQSAETLVAESSNVQYQLLDTLDRLNRTLESIERLAEYLEQNPSALVRGKGRPRD